MKPLANPILMVSLLGSLSTAQAGPALAEANPERASKDIAPEEGQGKLFPPSHPVLLARTAEEAQVDPTGNLDLTLKGVGFTGTTAVLIGGQPVADLRLVDDTTLQVRVPASLAIERDIRIFTPLGESQPLPPAGGPGLCGGVEVREDHFQAPNLDQSFLDEPFDNSECVLLPKDLRPQPGRFQPMIQEGETGYVPSEHFLDLAPKLALMNHLAYERGKNYDYGHQLTLAQDLAGWDITSFSAIRGFCFEDRNAGFVAHSRGLNTIVVAFHGSIESSDWVSNLSAVAVRLDQTPGPEGTMVPLLGRAHLGFLHKYQSCRKQILDQLRALRATLTPEEKATTKYYVTGHSQGGILAAYLGADLNQLLRNEDPGFDNARDNRLHLWLLAPPNGMDATAVAYLHATVGRQNILTQNTYLDPVNNTVLTAEGVQFVPVGIHASQSAVEALIRSEAAHRQAVATHIRIGAIRSALTGAVPVNAAKHALAALHMCTDNHHRGVGVNYAFDVKMVTRTLEGLNLCLQAGFNAHQLDLQAKAIRNARVKTQYQARNATLKPLEVAEPAPTKPASRSWLERLRTWTW